VAVSSSQLSEQVLPFSLDDSGEPDTIAPILIFKHYPNRISAGIKSRKLDFVPVEVVLHRLLPIYADLHYFFAPEIYKNGSPLIFHVLHVKLNGDFTRVRGSLVENKRAIIRNIVDNFFPEY